jgi:hypothetical protein
MANKIDIKKSEEQLLQILEDFDYDKVREYMLSVNWTYLGQEHVPYIEELKRTARVQIYCALESVEKTNEATHCGSGGFNVYIFKWGVKLSFEPFCSRSY